MLWPGLQGKLDALINLGGSPEHPHVEMTAEANSVSFNSHSLETLTFNGKLQGNDQLSAELTAIGLVADLFDGKQNIGNLNISLAGTLTQFLSKVNLASGVANVNLRTSGGWDGEHLTQRFEYGRVQPDGFDSWQLTQEPELRLSATTGQMSAHCWKQHDASICIKDSNWSPDSLQNIIVIDNFSLNTLKPLLADGYSVDGTMNLELNLVRYTKGQQAQLRWRQSRTIFAYTDNIDTFETVLDDISIDINSDDKQTKLTASLTGEQGLNMQAKAIVSGPLVTESPLKAEVKGKLPDIDLLRPLLRRVVQTGNLEGELTVDLDTGGTLGDPLFTGGAYLSGASVELLDAGITLSEINLAAESRGGEKLQVTGDLRSGDGSAQVVGEVRATDKPELVADIHVQGQNLASLRTPVMNLDTSPDLRFHIGKDIFDIKGSITVPRASIKIRELPSNAVPRSTDVIVHTPDDVIEQRTDMIVTGDIEVLLGDDVRFDGFGLNSRLTGGLRLVQNRGGFLRSSGTVRVRDGFLTGYGRELRVDRGEFNFTGPVDNPLINIQVSRESIYENRRYIIGLRLTGTAQNVITEPFSRPAMSDPDILSFLLLDRPSSSENEAASAALALGLTKLVPGGDGILGLDEVSFETDSANQTAMVAGKRINDRLFVRYVFGALGQPGSFRIRYSLGRGFSLESSTGARQSLDLLYLLER
jgi:translocation and assembly module TamB